MNDFYLIEFADDFSDKMTKEQIVASKLLFEYVVKIILMTSTDDELSAADATEEVAKEWLACNAGELSCCDDLADAKGMTPDIFLEYISDEIEAIVIDANYDEYADRADFENDLEKEKF